MCNYMNILESGVCSELLAIGIIRQYFLSAYVRIFDIISSQLSAKEKIEIVFQRNTFIVMFLVNDLGKSSWIYDVFLFSQFNCVFYELKCVYSRRDCFLTL